MASKVRTIKLGSQGLQVSAQGLGCMGMSAFYGPPKPEPNMITLIHHAIDSGVTFLDTSDIYGPFTNEILIGKALKGETREKVQLATKFGVKFSDHGTMEVHGEPAYVRAACEASLKRLGVDYSALFEELGIGIVAYSPLGRGFLSSGPQLLETLSKDDFRKTHLPRLQPENVLHNKKIFDRVHEIATRKGCTPSQLALAWVHHQENDVCPIPGTTKIENLGY